MNQEAKTKIISNLSLKFSCQRIESKFTQNDITQTNFKNLNFTLSSIGLIFSFINLIIFFSSNTWDQDNLMKIYSLLISFINLLCLSWVFICNKNKKENFGKIIFFMVKFLLNQPFHICSVYILIYLKNQREIIYVVLVLQLLIKVFIINNFYSKWNLYVINTVTCCLFEWLFYGYIIPNFFSTFLCYFITHTIIELVCIILTYLKEKRVREEFFLNTIIKDHKNYTSELLAKMNQGYINYNKNRNVFVFNDYFKNRIIFPFIESEAAFIDGESKNYNNSHNYKKINSRSKEYNQATVSSQNELCLSVDKEDCNKKNLNMSPLKILNSSHEESKIIWFLNKLFKNLQNLNNNLLEELHLSINGELVNFIDLFYEKLLINENNEKFTEFYFLGEIKIKVFDLSSSSTTYQVFFRLIPHALEGNYLEFIFEEVSSISDIKQLSLIESENKSHSIFDYKKLIKNLNKNFRKITKNERHGRCQHNFKEHFINLESNYKNLKYDFLIKSDKDLLNSALYKIIFHSFKHTQIHINPETHVVVKSGRSKNESNEKVTVTKFEIFNNNLHIDPLFIELIENGKYLTYIQDTNCEMYNYIELFITHNLIKKIGSALEIRTGETGTYFLFSIINYKHEIEEFIYENDIYRPYFHIKQKQKKFQQLNNSEIISLCRPNLLLSNSNKKIKSKFIVNCSEIIHEDNPRENLSD
jgi:hypothetical protein